MIDRYEAKNSYNSFTTTTTQLISNDISVTVLSHS